MGTQLGSCSTCLSIGKDADVIAVQHRRHQLRDIPKHLLLGAVRPIHPVKLKALRSPHNPYIFLTSMKGRDASGLCQTECMLLQQWQQRRKVSLFAGGS